MSFNLEGDGLCTDLFQALWTKDELNFGPSVNIPDTVVFKFGQPVSWYFTGIDGKLKKKNKHNVINAKIEEGFTKHVLAGDIVSFYISTGNDTDEGDGDDPLTGTRIEYFDREGLHDFLFNRWKQNTGILQRFIEPKGVQNTMIRAMWSPKVCLLERRTNNRNLHDRRFGIYERAITYEGPDFHSEAAPLRGSVMPQRVQRVCETIVAHVAEVSFQKQRICRMVLNFKVDAKDRLWLMWSSSIRLSRDADLGMENISAASQPLTIDPIVKLPTHLKLSSVATYGKEARPPDPICCLSCGRTSPSDQQHTVPYKTIIAHFEQVLTLLKAEARASGNTGTLEWPPPAEMIEAAGGVGFGAHGTQNTMTSIKAEDVDIPPVLRKLHPKLTSDSYSRHKRDPLFLYKAVEVCEDCYLVYADYASACFGVQPKSLVQMGTRLVAARNQDDYLTPWGKEIGMAGRSKTSAETWQPVGQDGSTASKKRSLLSSKSAPPGVFAGSQRDPGAKPEVPVMIRSSEDAAYMPSSADSWTLRKNVSLDHLGAMPDIVEGVDRLADLDISYTESIKRREQDFFNEMAQSPKIGGSHPLAHLVGSHLQQKSLKSQYDWTNELSRHDKQVLKTSMHSPYDEPQILVEYMKPSSVLMPQEKNLLKPPLAGKGPKALKTSSAAQKHLDFLAKTIESVSKQIHNAQELQTTSKDLAVTREEMKKARDKYAQFAHPNQNPESSSILPSLTSYEGLPTVSEEEYNEAGSPVTTAKKPIEKKKPRVLFSVAKRLESRFVQVICTEETDQFRQIVFSLSISQPATGEKWTLKINAKDLRLAEVELAGLPEKSKKLLLTRIIEKIQFVGTGDHVGVAYQYSSDIMEGIFT